MSRIKYTKKQKMAIKERKPFELTRDQLRTLKKK